MSSWSWQPRAAVPRWRRVSACAGVKPALIAFELVPQAFTARTWRPALAGTAAGATVMLALSTVLGV